MATDWDLLTEEPTGYGAPATGTYRTFQHRPGETGATDDAARETKLRAEPRLLSVSGPAAEAAVEKVRADDLGAEVPARETFLHLVEAAEGDVYGWNVSHPDFEIAEGEGLVGNVSVDTPQETLAGALVDAEGEVAEVRHGPRFGTHDFGEAAGVGVRAPESRYVTRSVDPADAPRPFGGVATAVGADVELGTAVYSLDGTDVAVSGDLAAVDDLDADDRIVWCPWPDSADRDAAEAVDADVSVVEPGAETGVGPARLGAAVHERGLLDPDWTLVTDEPAESADGEPFRQWRHADGETHLNHHPGQLVVEGPAADEAVAFVRDRADAFDDVPGLDAALDRVADAGDGVDAWVAVDPEESAAAFDDWTGLVHGDTADPATTATAYLDGDATDETIVWPGPTVESEVAAAAGLDDDEFHVRNTYVDVDADAVPAPFDDVDAETTTRAYASVLTVDTAEQSGDALVLGDPTAFDLDPADAVAVCPWPPETLDEAAAEIDAGVVTVDAADLDDDPVERVGDALRAALDASLVRTLDTDADRDDAGRDGNGQTTG